MADERSEEDKAAADAKKKERAEKAKAKGEAGKKKVAEPQGPAPKYKREKAPRLKSHYDGVVRVSLPVTLWAQHAPRGFAHVEYHSEYARAEADRRG